MFCMADFCAILENGAGQIDRRKDRDRRQEAEMDLSKYNIGLGITGSFCMFARARKEIRRLTELGANVIPIFSFQSSTFCLSRQGKVKKCLQIVPDCANMALIRKSSDRAALRWVCAHSESGMVKAACVQRLAFSREPPPESRGQ